MREIYHRNRVEGVEKYAWIETYGCAQNENDTERLWGMLHEMGYRKTDDVKKADVILYNTCCVRENAELRVFGNIGALAAVKRANPDVIIGICGCMMQQEHIVEHIKSRFQHVDIVFGTHTLYRFPQILNEALLSHQRVFDISHEDGTIAEGMPILRDGKYKARVSVMYGCNNFCSYCIVPYVRGRERSRSADEILSEIRALAQEGVSEVMLLGQNVNSYGKDLADELSFAQLLRQVDRIEGIRRIRFMTSHPKDLGDDLILAIQECKHVCPQLHLPVQAGSNRILELMNRKYTREKYLSIIQKVKQAVPDITLSSDIIVGFPGETNADFEETLSLVRTVEFDTLFTFIYSKRRGTPAEKMEDVLTSEEKHKNFERLLEVQNEISLRKNEALVGKTLEVLVEGKSKTNDAVLTGRTPGNKVVNFKGPEEVIGTYQTIRIKRANTWNLIGEDL
jgi:tRNA-2-methylthio-N6-dimethylallyladenosine synthase